MNKMVMVMVMVMMEVVCKEGKTKDMYVLVPHCD